MPRGGWQHDMSWQAVRRNRQAARTTEAPDPHATSLRTHAADLQRVFAERIASADVIYNLTCITCMAGNRPSALQGVTDLV